MIRPAKITGKLAVNMTNSARPNVISHTGREWCSPGITMVLNGARLAAGGVVATTLIALPALAEVRFSVQRLEPLGTDPSGLTNAAANAVSAGGDASGYSQKFSGSTAVGLRAVRWATGGTAATELGNLGTDAAGSTNASANVINAAGVTGGFATKWSGNSSLGSRAVLWASGSTIPQELGHLGTNAAGVADADILAINSAGAVAGFAGKYSGNTSLGIRAVRWAAGGTAATELASLGTNSSGLTNAAVNGIDLAGDAVGYATKWSGSTNLGSRAVRWLAGGTAATELGNLGSNAAGVTSSVANGINTVGDAVGYATKFSGDSSLGNRAVRWTSGGTAAAELGNLGTDPAGFTNAYAEAVDLAGDAVGFATRYSAGVLVGDRAALWSAGGTAAVDLNAFIAPNSGWLLGEARGINDNGVIVGVGTFDPDGGGPAPATTQAFRLVPVPEPASVVVFCLAARLAVRQRRFPR